MICSFPALIKATWCKFRQNFMHIWQIIHLFVCPALQNQQAFARPEPPYYRTSSMRLWVYARLIKHSNNWTHPIAFSVVMYVHAGICNINMFYSTEPISYKTFFKISYLASWVLQLQTTNYLIMWSCFPSHLMKDCKDEGYTIHMVWTCMEFEQENHAQAIQRHVPKTEQLNTLLFQSRGTTYFVIMGLNFLNCLVQKEGQNKVKVTASFAERLIDWYYDETEHWTER